MGRRLVVVFTVALALAAPVGGCSDDRSFADRLCPVVRDWAAATTKAVNEFQEVSPTLATPAERRAAYLGAFARIDKLGDRFENQLTAMSYPRHDGKEMQRRLIASVDAARAEQRSNRVEAAQLPDGAFAAVQVADGNLFSGNEKGRAVVYAAVGSISSDFGAVGEACGRPSPATVGH